MNKLQIPNIKGGIKTKELYFSGAASLVVGYIHVRNQDLVSVHDEQGEAAAGRASHS